MSCCGKHKDRKGRPLPAHDAHDILPDAPCVLCADKHLSYAFHLSEEHPYELANRKRIVGALVAAAWHIHKDAPELAMMLRDIRHDVQHKRDVSGSRWAAALSLMDLIVEKELTP